MSDFIESEAEESEDEEELEEGEKRRSKKIKSAKIASDSDEDEEDDEDQIREENKGFINDDDEDEGSASDSDDGKRKRGDDDDDDDLDADNIDDEDLDLLEENLGVKLDRKKKFKRLKRIVDEDSDAEEEGDGREKIANEIFSGDEGEEELPRPPSGRAAARPVDEYGSEEEEGEESDGDGSFIVDDDGQPIQKAKRRHVFDDEGLEAARDIFGCDFDYDEFAEFEDYEDREDDEEDEDDDYDEEDGVEREKKKKKTIGKKERRGKVAKKSIYEVFEPCELERSHLTDRDQVIRKTDAPERFQLRQIPVTRSRRDAVEEAGVALAPDKELEAESVWVYQHAFYRPCISNQESLELSRQRGHQDLTMTQRIYSALDLMRNSTCEVPFIAFYRKEEANPVLNINDLWKIYHWDEKWCQLKARKENLKKLFTKMAQYQLEVILQNPDSAIPDTVRVLPESDFERIDEIETFEQFNDCYKLFLLNYGREQEAMREYFAAKEKEKHPTGRTRTVKVLRKVLRKKKKANIEDDEEGESERAEGEDEEEEVETEVETEVEEDEAEGKDGKGEEMVRKAVRRHEYELMKRCGIEKLNKMFGLTPEQFGMNLRDNYARFDVEQVHEDPTIIAEQYVSKMCPTPEKVLEASVRMVGWQLAVEPLVRRAARDVYFERSRLSVRPTPQGARVIDEQHALYPLRYLKDKPVGDLESETFLRLQMGVQDGLVTVELSDSVPGSSTRRVVEGGPAGGGAMSYLEEAQQLYYRDEFSQVVQDWNALRGRAVEFALKRITDDLKRELTQRLLQEAKDHVMEKCCSRLYDWIKVAPYNPGNFQDEDEEDWSTSRGFRVLALAYEPDLEQAAFGACIDADGDCCEYLRLPHLLKRRNGYNERNAMAKESDLRRLREFIVKRKPHAVVVGGESREALMVVEDVRAVLKELEETDQFPKVNVELMDNQLACCYAASKQAEQDFLDYPPLLRQAISLGRRLQDPLVEFAQLCNADDEILNLQYHSLQGQLNSAELLDWLEIEFVNRTNEVGVDLNRAVAYPYTQHLVQFVCGLGPRKAHALIKFMKQNNLRLENRNQLVVNFHMGPKVFINCAGFIKIDTTALGDSDNYIEVLDSTRIHPEAYDWARKMAVDALEYDDEEGGKPAEAIEEILETPERLNELDLEAFAAELHNQGFGRKNTTLYDIRHELHHRYKDFRTQYISPSAEEVFNMLTKETPDTFFVGKMVQATVVNFIHRKPKGEQLDQANPVRNEDTGLWQCPFCLKNDFPELSEVWNHFDSGDCPGESVGIRVRLDNGISGFIGIRNLSDKKVTNPAERVRIQGLVFCRILKVDPERFSVDLTSRSSDLQDADNKWKPPKDAFYDFEAEDADRQRERRKTEKKKTAYHKRVIAHPSFRNVDYAEAEKIMQTLEPGDYLIRPSSKGVDHLTVTWKVTEGGICQHVDVREQDKQNDFSLGKKLWIDREDFEDLDEIVARFVAPLAANARQVTEYKYYKEAFAGSKERAAEHLKEEKRRNPKSIPYVLSASVNLPGKFLLSYLPRVKVIHEYVTPTPEGFRFRQAHHASLAALLKWFKLNFRRAVPAPVATPGTGVGARTPMEPSGTHRAGTHLPPQLLHSLSQAAAGTPRYMTTPGGYSLPYANTPYTPSGQTPFMTPFATPGPSATPRYGAQTPSYGAPPTRLPHQSIPTVAPSRSNQGALDWSRQAETWNSRPGGGAIPTANPRDARASGHMPRPTTPRYPDARYAQGGQYSDAGSGGSSARRTPRYDPATPSYHGYDNPRATPRSARSTPKTIHSPTNMSIGGDQTPLYDE